MVGLPATVVPPQLCLTARVVRSSGEILADQVGRSLALPYTGCSDVLTYFVTTASYFDRDRLCLPRSLPPSTVPAIGFSHRRLQVLSGITLPDQATSYYVQVLDSSR